MQQQYLFKLIATLFITCSFLSATATEFNIAHTPLHTLLQQIKGVSAEQSCELSNLANQSLELMQSITQQLDSKNTSHQKIQDLFIGICGFFNAEDGVPINLINIQPHDVRAFHEKIIACNDYVRGHMTASTMNIFNKIIDFNQTVLVCIEDAVSQQIDYVDYAVDYLIYRPMEFISEHKVLTACCATVIIAGLAYYCFYSANNNIQPIAPRAVEGGNVRGITLVRGDITQQVFNVQHHAAIVNAAQPRMLGGGGIDGVIHRAAGPGLRAECQNAPIDAHGERCPVGQARITGGHNLAPLRIIHTVGPDTHIQAQNEQRAVLLNNAYQNSLNLAVDHEIRHIGLPSISTGIFGYPIEQAAEIAVQAAMRQQAENPLEEIRFITFNQDDFDVYRQILERRGWQQQ